MIFLIRGLKYAFDGALGIVVDGSLGGEEFKEPVWAAVSGRQGSDETRAGDIAGKSFLNIGSFVCPKAF